jgi:hypothetical protein
VLVLDENAAVNGGVYRENARHVISIAAAATNRLRGDSYLEGMVKFLLWLILFVVCWPVAVLALLLYPLVWLLLLPFRLVGIVVDGVFDFLRAIVRLPSRVLGARP